MSIENVLERIAVALEKLANAPTTQPAPTSTSAPTTTAPMTQASSGPPMATGPVEGPPVGVPPTTGPAPGPSPAPVATLPSTQAPAPQVQGVPTLDDIKALANDFHRAHPDKVGQFVEVLAAKGAQKLSDLPPASYPEVFGFLKEHMG